MSNPYETPRVDQAEDKTRRPVGLFFGLLFLLMVVGGFLAFGMLASPVPMAAPLPVTQPTVDTPTDQ